MFNLIDKYLKTRGDVNEIVDPKSQAKKKKSTLGDRSIELPAKLGKLKDKIKDVTRKDGPKPKKPPKTAKY